MLQLRIMKTKVKDETRDKAYRNAKNFEWNSTQVYNSDIRFVRLADKLLH